MKSLKTLSIAGAVAAASVLPARAADLLPPAPVIESVSDVGATELGTGWYLRGDVGYVDFGRAKDADASPDNPILRDISFGKVAEFGGGFGYKFTNWFRADVTGDYHVASKFFDWSSGSYDQSGGQILKGFNIERGRLDGALLLANAYIDLGTWYGLTPYVGAGIGMAQRNFREFYTQTTCLVGGCISGAGVGPLDPVYRSRRSQWDLAWALMGGVSASIGSGLSLDIGYRYVRLGDAQSGFDIGIDNPARTRLKDIDAHEVRLGVRYMID